MAFERIAYSRLLGGVSQQPDRVRDPSQCSVLDNGFTSILDGLGKRQPTEHIANLMDQAGLSTWSIANRNPKLYWFSPDRDARYLVIVDEGLTPGMVVIDATTGEQESLTGKNGTAISESVRNYLGFGQGPAGEPERDLRFASAGDETYIVNRTVEVEMEDALSDAVNVSDNSVPDWRSRSERRWFIFVRESGIRARYAVRVSLKTGSKFPDPNNRNTWDPSLEDENDLNVAAVKTFSGDATDYTAGNNTIIDYEGYGTPDDDPPYNPANAAAGPNSSVPALSHGGRMIGTLELDRLAQRLWSEPAEPPDPDAGVNNFNTRYPGGISTVFSWRAQLTKALETLLWMKNGQYNQRNGTLPNIGSVVKLEMLVGPDGGVNYNRAFVHFREKMNIEVVATGPSSDAMVVFSDEIDDYRKLPIQCEHGHVVKVAGDPTTEEDDYYLRFEVTEEGFEQLPYPTREQNLGTGRWVETCASLSKTRLDNSTMPHKLVRVRDISTASGYRFEIYPVDWAEKDAGDDESNPEPPFVGHAIEDLVLWKNRLGVVAGDTITLSEADRFENFWLTSVRQVLDSDPIYRTPGHRTTVHLRTAVALDNRLIVFADTAQFELSGDPLTPKTAAVLGASEFTSSSAARPLTVDRGIFFAAQSEGGAYSRVSQLLPDLEVGGRFERYQSSAQIPRFIRGDVVEFAASSVNSVLAVRSDHPADRHIVYVYKWFDERNGQRILSSWMRFLVGPSATTEVLGMFFQDDELVLCVRRKNEFEPFPIDEVFLEKINMADQGSADPAVSGSPAAPTGGLNDFRFFLDRRVSEEDVEEVYQHTDGSVVVVLPYRVQTDANGDTVDTWVVSREETDDAEGEVFAHVHAIKQVGSRWFSALFIDDPDGSVWSRWSQGNLRFFVGQGFNFVFEPSYPVKRRTRRDGVVETLDSLLLRVARAVIAFNETGYAKVTVGPGLHKSGAPSIDRTTYSQEWPLLRASDAATLVGNVNVRDGSMSVPIRGRPNEYRLTIENPTPFPSNLHQIELFVSVTQKGYSRG